MLQYLRQRGTNEVYAISNGGSYYVPYDYAIANNIFSQVKEVNYNISQKYPISGNVNSISKNQEIVQTQQIPKEGDYIPGRGTLLPDGSFSNELPKDKTSDQQSSILQQSQSSKPYNQISPEAQAIRSGQSSSTPAQSNQGMTAQQQAESGIPYDKISPEAQRIRSGQTSSIEFAPEGQNSTVLTPIPSSTTGNTQLDGVLDTLQQYLNQIIASGQQINPNITIDPSIVQQFLDQATKEISPYYAQQLASIKNDLTANLNNLQKTYDIQQQQAEQTFRQNLENAREQYAGAGLAFSGSRAAGEQNIQSAEQANLNLNAINASGQLGSMLRSAEQNVGSQTLSGLTHPTINQPIVNLVGTGGYSPGQTLSYFTPGNISGIIQKQQATDIQNRASQLQYDYRANRTLGNINPYINPSV